jgi:HK97 family phage major capsid protein
MNASGSGAQAVQKQIYGVPVYTSTQLNLGDTAFVAIPSEIVVVRRQDVRVEVDSSRLFNSDESEIRAIARYDLVVPNPEAVVLLEDVTPAIS